MRRGQIIPILLLSILPAAVAAADLLETDAEIELRCRSLQDRAWPKKPGTVESPAIAKSRADNLKYCIDAEKVVRDLHAGASERRGEPELGESKGGLSEERVADKQRFVADKPESEGARQIREKSSANAGAVPAKFYYPEIRPYMELSAQQLINRFDFFAVSENRTAYTYAAAYVARDACPVRDSATWGGEWKLGLIRVPAGAQLACWSEISGQKIRICRVDFPDDPASWCENVPRSQFRQIPGL